MVYLREKRKILWPVVEVTRIRFICLLRLMKLLNQLLSASAVMGIVGAFASAYPCLAQQANPVPHAVYTYVQQPPQLPGANNPAAISAAVQQQLVYPPRAAHDGLAGKVFVEVTIAPDGTVYAAKVVRGLRSDYDSAAVAAVQRLPRLSPPRQGSGRSVYYQFTQPVSFQLPALPGTH
jgi:TonB family protein